MTLFFDKTIYVKDFHQNISYCKKYINVKYKEWVNKVNPVKYSHFQLLKVNYLKNSNIENT